MQAEHLLSIYQGGQALAQLGTAAERRLKRFKSHELSTLRSFCDALRAEGADMAALDGWFAGYTIDRISKEFDLLRFGHRLVVNVELKAALRHIDKEEKMLRQMRANHHYLRFLERPLALFTFVDKDGFYRYHPTTDTLTPVSAAEVVDVLKEQVVDTTLQPDALFIPANYLLSPFKDSERFMNGQYFLTTSQQSVKKDILCERSHEPTTCFTLAAPSGTGKTLLLYDMAAHLLANGENIAIVHSAPLSEEQRRFLRTSGWPIYANNDVHPAALTSRFSFLLIDDAQQLTNSALDALLYAAQAKGTTLLLAFDTAPELGKAAASPLDSLQKRHANLRFSKKALSDKIRINNTLAAFIANLFKNGAKPQHPPYDCVQIDYLYEADDLRATSTYLTNQGWTLLTSDASGPGIPLAPYGAQDIQRLPSSEFSRVATILDRRFFYDPTGHLQTTDQTSAAKRALYQIITRTTNQLRLIVYNNPSLYLALLRLIER